MEQVASSNSISGISNGAQEWYGNILIAALTAAVCAIVELTRRGRYGYINMSVLRSVNNGSTASFMRDVTL